MAAISKKNQKPPDDKSDKNRFTELLNRAHEISAEAITEAAETDRTDGFPARTFEKLAEEGLLDVVIPEKFGGLGLGTKAGTTVELLKLLKILGYGNLVVGRIFEGHFNAWQLIGEYADNGRFEKLAEESLKKKHLFGVWNTEAGGGVEIFRSDENKFRLEGAKTFASGIDFVSRPIVTGRTEDDGWQMFVAEVDKMETTIDDSWWKPLGMRSSRSFRVDFSGAKISADDLVGQPDDYYRQPFFSGGAIRFAAVQLGAAELLLDLTRDFLRELNRTEDAFQQMRLGEMAIAVESGNLWLVRAAQVFDEYLLERNPSQESKVLNYAGMMRTEIERICQHVMIGCERSIGSRGLLQPYHFERVIRDLKMYLRQAAPDATLAGVGRFVLGSNERIEKFWNNDE